MIISPKSPEFRGCGTAIVAMLVISAVVMAIAVVVASLTLEK